MTGQVHQDLDTVLADEVGGLGVGETDKRAPMIGRVLGIALRV
jgi:hypothetical protein